jgi:hypothetical protein
MINGERGTKIDHQIFLGEEQGLKKDPQELVTTLGADAYGWSQIIF